MKPLFDLEELKAEIQAGRIGLHLCEQRISQLVELLGDDYKLVIKTICARLQSSDFCGHWGLPNEPGCADVYGIMSDTLGQRSEEEYAWYIKIGRKPGTSVDQRRWFLSFHPTAEIRLQGGTCLRTTADDFEECDDE